MTTQVIQTKRQPPLWKVRANKRIKAAFIGETARAKAEAYAAENHGEYEVREMTPTGKDLKRAAMLAEIQKE